MSYQDTVAGICYRIIDTGKPVLVNHPIFSEPAYGTKHPLSIPRLANVVKLIEALDLDHDPRQFITAPVATAEQLGRYHRADYVRHVLGCAEHPPPIEQIRKYNVGTAENPIFPGMVTQSGAACGGAIAAAEALSTLLHGTIFCPGSGAHHAGQTRASSFCYFNDPVLAILKMQDRGLKRIAYVDLDAHPGDGVEKAFMSYPDILTLSLHQPYGQTHTESLISAKSGRVNIVMPHGAGDTAYQQMIDHIVTPTLSQFAPEAIILQAGCDAIAEDPLSRLNLSNRQYWDMIDAVRDHAPRVLVLGGGGYHPWSVTRAWTGVWARLNDTEIPDILPDNARSILQNIHHPAFAAHPALYPDAFKSWCRHLEDAPRPGDDMPNLMELTDEFARHNFRIPEQSAIKTVEMSVSGGNSFRPRSLWS